MDLIPRGKTSGMVVNLAVAGWMLLCFTGCGKKPETPHQPKKVSAKELFDQTTKLYHLQSDQKEGAEKEKLLAQAAAGYEQLLGDCRDQPFWCAQALRSLGNVRTTQGRLDEAIKLYSRVAEQYPREDW